MNQTQVPNDGTRLSKKAKKAFLPLILLLVFVLAIVLLAGYIIGNYKLIPYTFLQSSSVPLKNIVSIEGQTFSDHQRISLSTTGSAKTFAVEVVTKPESITQGLSGRDSIGADGMLFITPWEGPVRFWMKDMKFDLDLVWIHKGQVVEISKQVPAPEPHTPTRLLPSYNAHQSVDAVLEIEAGKADEWGIHVGDMLLYKPSE